MVNNKLKEFIDSMGILCEVWMVTYNQFVKQGMSQKEALLHTQGFTTALISAIKNSGPNQEE